MNNIKTKNVKLFIITLIFSACFFIPFMPVKKAEAANNTISTDISEKNTVFISNSEDSSGVSELDEAMDRGTGVLISVIRTFGGIAVIIGIVLAAIGFFGHQPDMKAQSPIWIGAGIVIFFSPEIKDFLLGR